ncbi:hypothetical protein Q0N12_18975 [Rossellomorea marisflavi]|nr:hypothetical protein [Rossellomorea marisflavi]UTE73107.1 hypothetical protein M1I95_00745 [Rossellomorea marisflavi]
MFRIRTPYGKRVATANWTIPSPPHTHRKQDGDTMFPIITSPFLRTE